MISIGYISCFFFNKILGFFDIVQLIDYDFPILNEKFPVRDYNYLSEMISIVCTRVENHGDDAEVGFF